MANTRPILVTGTHRSGTTWVGRILSANSEVGYIDEPFHLDKKASITARKFPYWFNFICDQNEELFRDQINAILNFEYPLFLNLTREKKIKHKGRALLEKTKHTFNKITHKRPLLKDPIAFFSSEWLYQNFNTQNIVMIRHPAAFCSSLKIKNWAFDFNNFLNQPLLLDRHLQPFISKIEDFAKHPEETTIIDQAILIWNCVHHTIHKFKNKYSDWIFVRHEDLSRNPQLQFRDLYEKLDINFTNHAQNTIARYSGSQNPNEQVQGNEFVRDSRKNIYNWKSRLTEKEIEKIWENTHSISDYYYTFDEW